MTGATTCLSPAKRSAWLRPFSPRRGLRNAHLQTIVGNYLRRKGALPPYEAFVVEVEPAHTICDRDGNSINVAKSSVLCLAHWQPRAHEQLTVVLVHGLEGSADSGYMLGNTIRLWAAGCNVLRMNMRSCGGSDTLSPTIYHSGRSNDVRAVVQELVARGMRRFALIGYSMGGNMILRYAGEQSALPSSARDASLVAAIGVSPLLDLAASSAALHLPSNRFYEKRFLRAMKRRLRAKATLFPEMYGALETEGVYNSIRSLRDFDGEIVARFGGFRDADDYYEQVRGSRYATTLQVPTLILHSADDPFIRTLPATRAALLQNPCVDYIESAHGGHCAFLADPVENDQGRWAEEMIARWLSARLML